MVSNFQKKVERVLIKSNEEKRVCLLEKKIFWYETKSLKNLKYGKLKEMKKKCTGVLISISEQISLLTSSKTKAILNFPVNF